MLGNNFQFAFGCLAGDRSLCLYVGRYRPGFILYCTGSAVCPRYLPSFRGVVLALFPCVRVNIEYRQQRLHMQIRDASFALAHRRISHLSNLEDQHTTYQDFNFLSIPVTFFPAACITLRQKQRSIFTRYGPVSPVTAVGHNLFSGARPLTPISFHKIPISGCLCAAR